MIVQSQRLDQPQREHRAVRDASLKTVPIWAVVGTQDRIIPPDTQRHMAERAGATITDVAGSPVSMVSHPQTTIDAILTATASI